MMDLVVLGKVFWLVEFEVLDGVVFVVFDFNFAAKLVVNNAKDLRHFVGNIGSGNCRLGRHLQFDAHFLPGVSNSWAASGLSGLHSSVIGFVRRFGWVLIDRSHELFDASSRCCHVGRMLS